VKVSNLTCDVVCGVMVSLLKFGGVNENDFYLDYPFSMVFINRDMLVAQLLYNNCTTMFINIISIGSFGYFHPWFPYFWFFIPSGSPLNWSLLVMIWWTRTSLWWMMKCGKI
jgi:hypothetical protein